MVGSAMFSTVLSNTTISRLTTRTPRIAQRRGCPCGPKGVTCGAAPGAAPGVAPGAAPGVAPGAAPGVASGSALDVALGEGTAEARSLMIFSTLVGWTTVTSPATTPAQASTVPTSRIRLESRACAYPRLT